MPGALYNYARYGQGVQDFPVDRDGWSRREESPEPSHSITSASSTVMEWRTVIPPRVNAEPRAEQNNYKETRESSAPRMRTHAEIKAAKLLREQKKKNSAARVIQDYAKKWLDRNAIHILRRKLAERDEQLSLEKRENHQLRKELQRVYRAVDPSKKAIGCVKTLKQYQQVSGLVERALSKKRKSRWGITKVERLAVAQESVNKKY